MVALLSWQLGRVVGPHGAEVYLCRRDEEMCVTSGSSQDQKCRGPRLLLELKVLMDLTDEKKKNIQIALAFQACRPACQVCTCMFLNFLA